MKTVKISFLIGVAFLFLNKNGNGQNASSDPVNQLVKVIPASPNAVSLGIYGNTPVSYFTGTPSVQIPLYDISSGKLNLPISLSHHGGGIKVEEMASWVGLGWSLNAGGVITRTVRGTPDELANGFFNQVRKVQWIIDNRANPTYQAEIKDYLVRAGKGLYDLEADMFYFNFGSYSGKFFYDQQSSEFYTIPRSNLKINFDINGFIFTDENGFKYYFSEKEFTNSGSDMCTGGSTASPANNNYGLITTGWYLSKIENQNAADNITLEYADNNYSYQTTNSSVDYILTNEVQCHTNSQLPNMQANHCYQYIAITGKKLSYIRFNNGYLKFTAVSSRCDLTDDEALDKIELYNLQNQPLKRFDFEYSYFGNSASLNCPAGNPATRLKLMKVTEQNTVSGVTTSKPPHIFEYMDYAGNFGFPSRLSLAQDYWGYYNGAMYNTSLIPPYIIPSPINTTRPIYWPGADRKVNPLYNQIGTLVKIIYPTGGTTSFEYESNEIKDNALDPVEIHNYRSIEGDHNGGLQTHYESAPIVINEPPSPLNGNNPNGGALVNFKIDAIGNCYTDCNSPTTPCAILQLENITGGGVSGMIRCNINNFYIPNGTYKLTASFQQNPQQYEDFYFQMTWSSPDPNFANSQLAGGLRIKKIIDYDGIDHVKDIIKNFSYNNENDNISSGKINGRPLNYTSEYEQRFFSGYQLENGNCIPCDYYRAFIKRNSFSNYPLLSSSGGYVGYENVSVNYGGTPNGNGKTNYKYRYIGDDISLTFPFPTTTRDWQRGQVIEEKNYKNVANNLQLINKGSDNYDIGVLNQQVNPQKVVNGIKIGFNRSAIIDWNAPCLPHTIYQVPDQYAVPTFIDYETSTNYLWHNAGQKTTYDQSNSNNSIFESQVIEYNTANYQPNSISVGNSKQETYTTKITYPIDYAGCTDFGIAQLINNNMVTIPVEKYIIKTMANNQQYVVSGTLMKYSNGSPVPDKIYSLEINTPLLLSSFIPSYYTSSSGFVKDPHYVEQISFAKFDTKYNLLEQQKNNDVKEVYIWGYNSAYPVAKLVNTTYDIAKNYIDQNFLNAATNDDATVSAHLNNLRNIPGALVTTYTYKPLIGITSETDVNGKTIYYEYDNLNRLSLIRDKDNNIIKKICYNYAGQPETCIPQCTNTAPDWQNTAVKQCLQNSCGNTGYQQQQEKDMNPCSATYNQVRWGAATYNPTGCTMPNTTANWQNTTTALRCQQGSCGSTGYQEREQKDMNPCSPTYNQTQWINAGYNPAACALPSTAANWQNTGTPLRCQLNNNGQMTGYQEQEQVDTNPCSSTYNSTQWIVWTYNPGVCSQSQGINLTSTNTTGLGGYVAAYYNTSSGITYTFNVSAFNSLQPLGSVPAGTYNLTISSAYGSGLYCIFKPGCGRTSNSGYSATFYNIAVSNLTCNSITIAPGNTR